MLRGILHTGIEVEDLEQSVALYRSLGFQLEKEVERPELEARAATVAKDGVTFELWQFENKSRPEVAFIRNHIAIYSDDLDKDVKGLVDRGYKLVIPVTDGHVHRYAFVQDASGAFCYEIATDK
ncbi:VOC family protein [Candidatus Saccharibacteria bacterium]|nr:VOC family protein [Candidatus Saccharibacteria bacterium]